MKDSSLRIYVGGLSIKTREKTLFQYFSKFGNIKSVDVIYEKQTNLSKGYAFVSCEDQESFNKILETHHSIGGKALSCNQAFKIVKSNHLGDP